MAWMLAALGAGVGWAAELSADTQGPDPAANVVANIHVDLE